MKLGLSDVAARCRSQARRAGLRPPRRFGSEVVARLLGWRHDHPARRDRLELFPWAPITRAEAAHTLARAQHLGEGEAARVRGLAEVFVPPRYGAHVRAALRVAVAKVGIERTAHHESVHPRGVVLRDVRNVAHHHIRARLAHGSGDRPAILRSARASSRRSAGSSPPAPIVPAEAQRSAPSGRDTTEKTVRTCEEPSMRRRRREPRSRLLRF